MIPIAVWILVAIAGSNSSPTPIASFATQSDCNAAGAQLETQSRDKRGAPVIYPFCIQAKVIK